jgi:hypothetical protein
MSNTRHEMYEIPSNMMNNKKSKGRYDEYDEYDDK